MIIQLPFKITATKYQHIKSYVLRQLANNPALNGVEVDFAFGDYLSIDSDSIEANILYNGVYNLLTFGE